MTELHKAAESAKQVLENKRLRADEQLIAIVVDDLRQALAQWDTSDMAHRPNGLTVDVTDLIERAKAEEREACAKLCEQEHDNYLRDKEPDRADGAMWCAKAIRGRTE